MYTCTRVWRLLGYTRYLRLITNWVHTSSQLFSAIADLTGLDGPHNQNEKWTFELLACLLAMHCGIRKCTSAHRIMNEVCSGRMKFPLACFWLLLLLNVKDLRHLLLVIRKKRDDPIGCLHQWNYDPCMPKKYNLRWGKFGLNYKWTKEKVTFLLLEKKSLCQCRFRLCAPLIETKIMICANCATVRLRVCDTRDINGRGEERRQRLVWI